MIRLRSTDVPVCLVISSWSSSLRQHIITRIRVLPRSHISISTLSDVKLKYIYKTNLVITKSTGNYLKTSPVSNLNPSDPCTDSLQYVRLPLCHLQSSRELPSTQWWSLPLLWPPSASRSEPFSVTILTNIKTAVRNWRCPNKSYSHSTDRNSIIFLMFFK